MSLCRPPHPLLLARRRGPGWMLGMLLLPGCLLTVERPDRPVAAADSRQDTEEADSDSGIPVDADGDGYSTDDCDDDRADVHPDAPEYCGDVDHDCDGLIGNLDPDSPVSDPWYTDQDGDGYGAGSPTLRCLAQTGEVADHRDCNDQSATVHPGASEHCDGLDEDCNGVIDNDALDARPWYADVDGDNYGNPDSTQMSCESPSGYGTDAQDCDDQDAAVHPAATETCNGLDDDCDGGTDLGAVDAFVWYADGDGDGFGDPATTTISCNFPSGFTTNSQDCDDQNAAVYLAASEVCGDGLDNNCDGSVNSCEFQSTLGLDDADYRYEGSTGDQISFPAVADLDGDGQEDLLLGAVGSKTVYGCFAPLTGGPTSGCTLKVNPIGSSGVSALVSVGDMDQDGYDDIVISDFLDNQNGETGAVWFIEGGPLLTGVVAADDVGTKVVGEGITDYFGGRLASGDVDGDGYRDVLISAEGNDSAAISAGTVYGFTHWPSQAETIGDANLRITGEGQGNFLGSPLTPESDLNADGVVDVVVAAPGHQTGTVYIFYGPLSGDHNASTADFQITDAAEVTSLGGGADVDGDGTDDLLAGAPEAGSNGVAYGIVSSDLSGSALSLSSASFGFYVDEQDSEFGAVVLSAGDVDHDGFDDVLIGAPDRDTTGANDGGCFLLFGPVGHATWVTSLPSVQILAAVGGDDACENAGAIGDISGDGVDDLVVVDPVPGGISSAYLILGLAL